MKSTCSIRRCSERGRSSRLPSQEAGEFVKRIQAYLLKALHEAKVHTSWINPNADYDNAIVEFAGRILDEGTNRTFLDDFRAFQAQISHFGLFNSLSQTLLKLAAPGVPDTYQGTEAVGLQPGRPRQSPAGGLRAASECSRISAPLWTPAETFAN